MRRFLSAGQVCEALATKKGKKRILFPAKTLDNWCVLGIIRPTVEAQGTGRHRLFALLPDVLAIAAGRGLRANGFEFDTAAAVMRTIMSFSEEQILAAFAEDATCLTFIGPNVLPKLLRADGVSAAVEEFESNNTSGLHPSAIDLRRIYNNVLASISDEDRPHKNRVLA